GVILVEGQMQINGVTGSVIDTTPVPSREIAGQDGIEYLHSGVVVVEATAASGCVTVQPRPVYHHGPGVVVDGAAAAGIIGPEFAHLVSRFRRLWYGKELWCAGMVIETAAEGGRAGEDRKRTVNDVTVIVVDATACILPGRAAA